MSIRDLNDWGAVELAAQTHELNQVDTPKIPPATIEQQLAWATMHCAELQAKVHRMQRQAMEAHMYLSIGAADRATQAISAVILDL